jgi:hypothetical protein
MNERILKLGNKAGMYVDINGNLWPCVISAEECEVAYKKFAELIIEQLCYDIMDVCGESQVERIQYVAKDWGVEL